jgi:hypothetical protein
MNLDILRAPAVHAAQQDGLFSAPSLHALEIACQTSGFKFLVQPLSESN